MSIVASNTKRLIKDKGLLQKSVAEKAGYGQMKFSAMMNGRKLITDVDIVNIARALNVSASELFKSDSA